MSSSTSLKANQTVTVTHTYTPSVGYTGPDPFTYTIRNSTDATLIGTGTVSITVTNRVWYVKNNVAGPGTGTSTDPFKTLAGAAPSAENSSAAGDVVFVFFGDGTNGSQNAGIALKDGQQLIGEITSGGFGPSLNAPMAMGYVRRDHSDDGSKLCLMVRGNPLPATVVPLPFMPHRYVR